VPYVLRRWARENSETLVNYLQAMIEGLRWLFDPGNWQEAVQLASARLHVTSDIAAEIVSIATDPKTGLAPDAAFDLDGFKTVLRLRAAFQGRDPDLPEKYFDLTWRRRALARL
jgi:ABC-type nitrate/sulfonate/bicarbonate transport system substrate-binding protein